MNTTVLITAAGLGSTLGLVLSLVFNYFPRLKLWYAARSDEAKSLIMIGLLLLVAAGTLVYQCNGVLGCIQLNWGAAGVAFVMALITNQGTFLISPQTPSVKRIKRARDAAVLFKLARDLNLPMTASSSLRDRANSTPPRNP